MANFECPQLEIQLEFVRWSSGEHNIGKHNKNIYKWKSM